MNAHRIGLVGGLIAVADVHGSVLGKNVVQWLAKHPFQPID